MASPAKIVSKATSDSGTAKKDNIQAKKGAVKPSERIPPAKANKPILLKPTISDDTDYEETEVKPKQIAPKMPISGQVKRIIKDYRTVTDEQLKLITEHFPDGIDSEQLISFTNAKGEFVKALEIRTEDTIYLFKFSAEMINKIDDITEDDYSFEGFEEFKEEDTGKASVEDDEDDDDTNEPADDEGDDDDDED